MLRKKAAEELKKEQERKAEERRRTIDQRCGQKKDLEGVNEGKNLRNDTQLLMLIKEKSNLKTVNQIGVSPTDV